jgi:segregation and condensation protein B
LDQLTLEIESMIFAADKPLKLADIISVLNEVHTKEFTEEEIKPCLEILSGKYQEMNTSFEIVEIADGFSFLTKPDFHPVVSVYLKQTQKKKLSTPALETLSIIAYRQPITKTEIEIIRGVSCDHAIHKLLEKELVSINGRSEGPGRPLLYGTTEKFMDYLGIRNMNDLPKPKDFVLPEHSIGEEAPIDETADLDSLLSDK